MRSGTASGQLRSLGARRRTFRRRRSTNPRTVRYGSVSVAIVPRVLHGCLSLMTKPPDRSASTSCTGCNEASDLGFDFTFAFQPIVDVDARRVFSYEALVRGCNGEGAFWVLDQINERNRYSFDQACRRKALTLAARLRIETYININFMPNAVYRPELCIRSTLAAARHLKFPIERIMFEVSEGEQMTSPDHLVAIFKEYRRLGITTAIDDFGAGYSGLNLLADYQPDYIKLDLKLIRNVDSERTRQAIVRAIVSVCRELDIAIIAEGIEYPAEATWLRHAGVRLFQGYLFARPAFEALPAVAFEPLTNSAVSAA